MFAWFFGCYFHFTLLHTVNTLDHYIKAVMYIMYVIVLCDCIHVINGI